MILTFTHTHTHTHTLRHTSALPKIESCKITVSEGIYHNLARAHTLGMDAWIPQKVMKYLRDKWTEEEKDQGGFAVFVWDLFGGTLMDPSSPDFKPKGNIQLLNGIVGRQSAFLSDNQLEDSDTLLRLRQEWLILLWFTWPKWLQTMAAHCD